MARSLRMAFIGVGGNGRHHLRLLNSLREVKLVAIADTNQENLRKAQAESAPKANLYADYRDLLRKEELDAVGISTPHTLHYEHVMASLRRGLHVLVEKPMVYETTHARRVVREAKTRGLVVTVAYQRHFQPAFRSVRRRLASGALGPVHFVSAVQSQGWYRGTRGSWRQDPSLSGGGQLWDSGSHLMDIVHWMTDLRPAEVFAFENKFDTRVDILDALSIRYRGGALASIGIVGHSVGWHEEIAIWCDNGALLIREGNVHEMVQGRWAPITEGLPPGTSPDEAFVKAVLHKGPNDSPPECGLITTAISHAAQVSAQTGEPVKMRL